jgi:hypothetical protein
MDMGEHMAARRQGAAKKVEIQIHGVQQGLPVGKAIVFVFARRPI